MSTHLDSLLDPERRRDCERSDAAMRSAINSPTHERKIIMGLFVFDECDSVRLETEPGNDAYDRSGWVNCGAFAIALRTNAQGDLTLEVYPRGNELLGIMGTLYAYHNEAVAAGGKDFARENGG